MAFEYALHWHIEGLMFFFSAQMFIYALFICLYDVVQRSEVQFDNVAWMMLAIVWMIINITYAFAELRIALYGESARFHLEFYPLNYFLQGLFAIYFTTNAKHRENFVFQLGKPALG
jgi:hypothetical protein